MNTQENSQTPTKVHLLSATAAWFGLLVFTIVFSRPSFIFPLSFVAVMTIFLGGALYKEQPPMRLFAITAIVGATVLCLFTFFSVVVFKTTLPNLLDIEAHPLYAAFLLPLWFFTTSNFISLAFCLVKFIKKSSSAVKLTLFNMMIYALGVWALRHIILNPDLLFGPLLKILTIF